MRGAVELLVFSMLVYGSLMLFRLGRWIGRSYETHRIVNELECLLYQISEVHDTDAPDEMKASLTYHKMHQLGAFITESGPRWQVFWDHHRAACSYCRLRLRLELRTRRRLEFSSLWDAVKRRM